MPDDDNKSDQGFLKKVLLWVVPKADRISLAKLLAWVLAVFTTASGIIVAFRNIKPTEAPKDPYTVIVTHARVVPIYLLHYYEAEGMGADQSLYLLRAKVQNKTKEPLSLKFSLALVPSDCKFVQLARREPVEVTAQPGETVRDLYAALQPTIDNFDRDCYLNVNWMIDNPQKDKLYRKADVAEIKLLRPGVVKWDLLNSEGKPVSREFLFASLSAWSLTRDGRVLKRAAELGNHAEGLTPQQWVSLCYESLFRGRDSIVLYPTARTYPFQQEKLLETPGEVLSQKQAEPLEASLLMAALIRAANTTRRSRLSLLVVPRAQDSRDPSVLLAWLLPNAHSWEAIDLRRAKELDFRSNLAQTQELIQQLPERQRMIDSLRERGVFIDSQPSSPAAVSFDRAVQQFNVRPLE
jgi:hypothetical protein